MIVKEVSAGKIKDTRGEDTISITIKTDAGTFSSSAPNGKSKGKFESKPYKKSLSGDVQTIKKIFDYFEEIEIEEFSDLAEIEEICEKQIGANTLYALESCVLKALAKEQGKEVFQLINEKAKTIPTFIQNVVGGGKHSKGKKPDFQEFLLISDNVENNLKAYDELKILLKKKDEHFEGKKNDENAWQTSLNEKQVLDILTSLRDKYKFQIGVDIAASTFYSRKRYYYNNPKLIRSAEEQMEYIKSLINNFSLFYIEDPFQEEDFDSFSELIKSFPGTLIVGDDLTVTNPEKVERAIELQSISAMIIKPNQIGSLLKVKEVVDLCKEHRIKTIFSHRSGETSENILADLAIGFEADYIKCGIQGQGRNQKIDRILQIGEMLER
ncbi:MAG: enolase C-terminal domain-like protein [Nanoarchaeota archaeon]